MKITSKYNKPRYGCNFRDSALLRCPVLALRCALLSLRAVSIQRLSRMAILLAAAVAVSVASGPPPPPWPAHPTWKATWNMSMSTVMMP